MTLGVASISASVPLRPDREIHTGGQRRSPKGSKIQEAWLRGERSQITDSIVGLVVRSAVHREVQEARRESESGARHKREGGQRIKGGTDPAGYQSIGINGG